MLPRPPRRRLVGVLSTAVLFGLTATASAAAVTVVGTNR
jgi:hypothetical protein